MNMTIKDFEKASEILNTIEKLEKIQRVCTGCNTVTFVYDENRIVVNTYGMYNDVDKELKNSIKQFCEIKIEELKAEFNDIKGWYYDKVLN